QDAADARLSHPLAQDTADLDPRAVVLELDLDLRPGGAAAVRQAQRLEHRLLGGPQRREMLGRVLPRLAPPDLVRSVDAGQEALAVFLDHGPDAGALHNFRPHAEDVHGWPLL